MLTAKDDTTESILVYTKKEPKYSGESHEWTKFKNMARAEWMERAPSCGREWEWPVLSFQWDICWYGAFCLYIQCQWHGPWQRLLSVGIREEVKWKRFSCDTIPLKRGMAKRLLKLEHQLYQRPYWRKHCTKPSTHMFVEWMNKYGYSLWCLLAEQIQNK